MTGTSRGVCCIVMVRHCGNEGSYFLLLVSKYNLSDAFAENGRIPLLVNSDITYWVC